MKHYLRDIMGEYIADKPKDTWNKIDVLRTIIFIF
jgi:hypothetical protein